MKKVKYFIAFIVATIICIAFMQTTEMDIVGMVLLFMFNFLIIFLSISGATNFIHRIGKDAANINRKEGSKYEKTLGADYIRELPNYYTPALVSFVHDSAIEYNKDVLATILHLINEDYLKIENDRLVVIEKNIDGLYEHEKYIYDVIYNGLNPTFTVYKDKLIKDAYSLNLVKKADNSKLVGKGIFKLFFGRFTFPILLFLLIPFIPFMGSFGIILFVIVMFAIPIMSFRRFGKGISYLIAAGTRKVELSETGKLDQEKIYMFMNFLKEFTSLDKKTVKDIHLWDEYLIYALVLGVNKKIYEDEKLRDIVNKVQRIIVSDYKNDMLS